MERQIESLKYLYDRIEDGIGESAPEIKESLFFRFADLYDAVIDIKAFCLYIGGKASVSHYTQLENVRLMSDIRTFRFRLYAVDYMNDPQEGNILERILKHLKQMPSDRAANSDDIEEFFSYREDQGISGHTFIGSFVSGDQNDDRPEMWRLYGKHGAEEAAGCSLCFDSDRFGDNIETLGIISDQFGDTIEELGIMMYDIKYPTLYRVIYESEAKDSKAKKPTMYALLQTLRHQLIDLHDHVRERPKSVQALITELAGALLDEIRWLFKADYYKMEKEYRVIETRYPPEIGDDERICIDEAWDNLRFYIEASGDFRFHSITLGHKVPRPKELALLLKRRFGEEITVKPSAGPFW